MKNLNEEYVVVDVKYQREKEYRKTPEGKEALARANRRHRIKKKVQQLYDKSKTKAPVCYVCGETFLGHLTIDNSDVICYNCKFGIDEVEIEEICQ